MLTSATSLSAKQYIEIAVRPSGRLAHFRRLQFINESGPIFFTVVGILTFSMSMH